MAVYRPHRQSLRRQVDSLVAQTIRDWRCEIAIDGGSDEDVSIVMECVAGDDRFNVTNYPNRVGFYRNFERALMQVEYDVDWIALSDQDDHWYGDKLEKLIPELESAMLVSGQARVVHEDLVDENVGRRTDRVWNGLFADILDNTITGSFSIFRASLLPLALPFPRPTDAAYHDHWLGICAAIAGEVKIIDECLQDYIQHDDNVLGETQSGGWIVRLGNWRARSGGFFSASYLAEHRWGWRVRVAEELLVRTPNLSQAVRADVEPFARGGLSLTLFVRSIMSVWKGEAPAGRVGALLVGATVAGLSANRRTIRTRMHKRRKHGP